MDTIKELGVLEGGSSESLPTEIKSIFDLFIDYCKSINKDHPLGNLGDKTINDVLLDLKNLNWDIIFNNAKLSVNLIKFGTLALSYGITVRTFYKLDSRFKCPSHYNSVQKANWLRAKQNRFFLFSVICAPVIVCALNISSLHMKDVLNVEVIGPKLPVNEGLPASSSTNLSR